MSHHVIRAFLCDGHGGGTDIASGNIAGSAKKDEFTWVHLDADHPESRVWLESEIAHLDPYIIDGLLAVETRPRMMQIKNGAMLILRGANLNKNADPEDMVSIRLWVESNRVITVRRRKVGAIIDLIKALEANEGPTNTGHFVCMLMERLFRRIEPVLAKLDETTDDIEESVLTTANVALREDIIDVRKQAIMFRRYMVPQRDAIDQFRMANFSWLVDSHRRTLQENYNHVTRYLEDLDAIRERSQIVKDELANMLTDKLNKNTYMLSVIAAIFLPLGFLTGLLGINVGGIPGSDYPGAFAVFCGILVIIVGAQIAIFKKLKWF